MAESLKAKVKRAPKKNYKMPEKFPKGEILTDTHKVSWTIQNSIGVGGFGEIYAASKTDEPSKILYAVKIEPHENGPLFCERTVYLNIGKKESIDEFIKDRKLKLLGFPIFFGFGSHMYKNVNYRFIVIEKLGQDIWFYFKEAKKIPFSTIMKIAVQILHVLEYMHSKGYVHCDVKGTNLLLGATKITANQVYLVDLGLACKYSASFSPNPKKAHNGTIEYTSRDAHLGAMTRRGDVEILGYNLLHWATGGLPWEKLKTPPEVAAKKEELMKSIPELFAASPAFKGANDERILKEFFTIICKLGPTDEPPYKKLIEIFTKELKKLGSDLNKLEFDESRNKTPLKKKRELSPVKNKRELSPVKKRDTPKTKTKTVPRKKKEVSSAESGNEDESPAQVKKVKKTEVEEKTRNGVSSDKERRLPRQCKNCKTYSYSDDSS